MREIKFILYVYVCVCVCIYIEAGLSVAFFLPNAGLYISKEMVY
jgi:hypothetical protein